MALAQLVRSVGAGSADECTPRLCAPRGGSQKKAGAPAAPAAPSTAATVAGRAADAACTARAAASSRSPVPAGAPTQKARRRTCGTPYSEASSSKATES